MPIPNRILMANPEHFDICNDINPLKKSKEKTLNKVNKELALKQWESLKRSFEQLAFEVIVLPANASLPSMVFSANQAFPFWDLDSNKKSVVLSQMANRERQPEVAIFKSWFLENNYKIIEDQISQFNFEGTGDAIIHPSGHFIWGGHGTRTDKKVYKRLAEITGLPVVLLKTKRKEFYQLDTCFAAITSDTLVIEPSSFSEEAHKIFEHVFSIIVEVDKSENLKHLVCNCICLDGSTVIVNAGSESFRATLKRLGFRIVEIDLSEYLKAGGTAYSLKMMVY